MAKKIRNVSFRTLEMLEYQNGVCFWCLRRPYPFETIHADHIVPESRGGTYTVATCASCNLTKGTHSWDGFFIRRMIELSKLFRIEQQQTDHWRPYGIDWDQRAGKVAFTYITELDFVLFASIIMNGRIYPITRDSVTSCLQYDSRSMVSAMFMQIDDVDFDYFIELSFIFAKRFKTFRDWIYYHCAIDDQLFTREDYDRYMKGIFCSSDGDLKELDNADSRWLIKQSGQLGRDIIGWRVQMNDTSLFDDRQ